ncbi:MAG: electron transport complex subunit RsxC [Gammaproteobacteria bacterium]
MTANAVILRRFHGGLHLPSNKHQSTGLHIARAPVPKRLILPLQQHIGEPAEALVEVGERVLKGQVVARASGYVSVPVHASSSGTVAEIGDHPVPHPSGLSAPCIVIDTDGEDEWTQLPEPTPDYTALDPSALRNRVRDAGIVGLGGAGFPSFIKLNPGAGKAVDTLVLNGAECEPYISCDDMLMREHPEQIIRGAQIMRHALHAGRCLIGIEDNKPEAAAALREALKQIDDPTINVVVVPTIYPTGGEKQLIRVLTGKEVPSNGLPLDIGVVCHNVATAAAVYAALHEATPLISRIVTVTGGGVGEPRNLEVRIGTPVRELIEYCGGYTDVKRLVLGGPMMGFTLLSDDVPITKTSNCILAATLKESPEPPPPMPCIRCGSCAEVCPAQLLPQQLYWHSRSKEFDKVQDYHLFDCIECGCCAYVCPSHIPLVHYYRFAKTEIWAQEREKRKAEQARRRHEFHTARLEREKAEREARMRKKKAALKKDDGADDSKKAAIDAAMQRVREKQAKASAEPRNTDSLTEDQRRKIAEVDERRRRGAQAGEAAPVDNDNG